MRWFKPKLRSSLYAIFSVGSPGGPGDHPPTEVIFTVEDIRETMLDLATIDHDARSGAVVRRIRYAADLEALWYIRGELMALLARNHGEGAALDKLEGLSSMFADLLPRGLRSRPSPLSSNYRGERNSDE
ncbi:MAG: hypothetical protein JWP22_3899 [Ramlibacter sp.]|jgi:hypothetical protein|nr:hypothetical protein [Ramlibacter sp.]MDB5915224.1 hypothetical protein [Ramlibacter sp.]